MPRTPTLKERLDACATKGALSTADLATWFDLSYQTMRSYRGGVEPYPARQKQIEQRLQWLEKAVKKHPSLPVPLEVRAASRKLYILRVRRDCIDR